MWSQEIYPSVYENEVNTDKLDALGGSVYLGMSGRERSVFC